jgi:multiple sugar transport system permease protein
VFTAYPVAASLFYSFCDYSILKAPVWCGLENYRQLAAGRALLEVAPQHPLLRRAVRAAGHGGLAGPRGAAQPARCAGGRSSGLLFFMPSIVPVVASAMLWLWIFNGQYGLMNGFLDAVSGDRSASTAPHGWRIPLGPSRRSSS